MRPRLFLPALLIALLAAAGRPAEPLPYRQAGLTEHEAAAILLDRFAYGARPGEVERVVAQGLEQWLEAQLSGSLPEPALEARLARLPALGLSAEALARTYPSPGVLRAMAAREGAIGRRDSLRRSEAAQALQGYMAERGLRPQRELVGVLMAQKLLRAVYAENQLQEVLTDFWFNHFNVALQDNQARGYLLSYERDALRPHALGRFRALLGATARHPAMLAYLDNAQSTAADTATTTARPGRRATAPQGRRARRGLNENYARELLELHTLGVDGGYTQADVVAVARAFTGWTVLPPAGPQAEALRRRLAQRGARSGFVVDGLFLFRADAHDAGAKTILGRAFPAGGGLDEGERVLDLLAAHPATARRVAHKLAVRFVADEPPPALVDHLAGVYLATDGDVRALVRALAYHPAFWAAAVRRDKVKTPLELMASAFRALDARVRPSRALFDWLSRMGQPLYAHLAPTGYPDRAEAWINAGTLVSRMNFALSLATGRLPGVRVDLRALAGGREPASTDEALATYAALLMPGQLLPPEALAELRPLAHEAALPERLALPPDSAAARPRRAAAAPDDSPLARAVGVLLGAPAFQRR